MAKHKIKKPTLTQEVQALKISTNLMAQEMTTLTPRLRNVQSGLDSIGSKIEHMRTEQEELTEEPPPFTAEQFEQLRMAVNKIAAYAAAMDETKKTMIKLTSARIDKLDRRVTKLRVRLKRLKE